MLAVQPKPQARDRTAHNIFRGFCIALQVVDGADTSQGQGPRADSRAAYRRQQVPRAAGSIQAHVTRRRMCDTANLRKSLQGEAARENCTWVFSDARAAWRQTSRPRAVHGV